MKKLIYTLFFMLIPMLANAQGWPEKYPGVMLQGFYWDSFSDTKWTKLESQAEELSQYFDLVWIPQSANCGGLSMGYDDLYWFSDYNSSFGNETELRSLISTFKSKGIGTIADVVINHRKDMGAWVNFPAETYKGVTYQLLATDVCKNDDGGYVAQQGYTVGPNNDTGEDWSGMRDLDHMSENVQNNVKAYLNLLLNDLGYTGFRYDMVKGYAGSYTGMYNKHANPTYSVGEYWDGNATTVKNWLNATKVDGAIQSAVFDFPFRYTVRDAINTGNWKSLANTSVMADKAYQRYAVTFVENHDTERRSNAEQDPIKKDTLAANAFMLAMPGTPCVFLKHWQACKQDIKLMINARKMAGIHNQSTVTNFASQNAYYANKVTGTNGDLLVVVGTTPDAYTSTSRYTRVAAGHHYRYYLSNSMNTAWCGLPSGTYDKAQKAKLVAVTADANAKIVYTLDGSKPTASSTAVASNTEIDIPMGVSTLTIGLLLNGSVSAISSYNYNIYDFQPYEITVYTNADNVGWSNINYWTWGGDGTHAPTKTSWPGDRITQTTTANGKTWWYKKFTINKSDDYVNFVFSTGSGSPQTVDIENINKDTYFEISTEKDGTKHKVNDVTSTITAIEDFITINKYNNIPVKVYSIDGRPIQMHETGTTAQEALSRLGKGIYIINGKKFIVK